VYGFGEVFGAPQELPPLYSLHSLRLLRLLRPLLVC